MIHRRLSSNFSPSSFLSGWGSRREGKPQAPQRKKVGKQSQYFSIILNIHLWGSCSPQMSQFLDFYGDVYVCVYYTLFSNGNIDLGNNCWTVKNHLHKLLPPLLLVSERGRKLFQQLGVMIFRCIVVWHCCVEVGVAS